MILFAFHLARENIEQLASTNGVFNSLVQFENRMCEVFDHVGTTFLFRNGGRKERRLRRFKFQCQVDDRPSAIGLIH